MIGTERMLLGEQPDAPPVEDPGAHSIMALVVELAPDELWVQPIHRMITGIDATDKKSDRYFLALAPIWRALVHLCLPMIAAVSVGAAALDHVAPVSSPDGCRDHDR